MYDYLIVGAGLYGAAFAGQATDAGKPVLVIERRHHIAGNVYTENMEGINRTQRVMIHYRFVGYLDLPDYFFKSSYKVDTRQGIREEYLRSPVAAYIKRSRRQTCSVHNQEIKCALE